MFAVIFLAACAGLAIWLATRSFDHATEAKRFSGPITVGGWAGRDDQTCSPSDGLLFIRSHHFTFSNGSQNARTPWIDIEGSVVDPVFRLSIRQSSPTSSGWMLRAHVEHGGLNFSTIEWFSDQPPGSLGDVSKINEALEGLKRSQPWHQCPDVHEPAN